MGALKGNVLNADGSTSLANMFTTFGVAQTTVDFTLGTAGTKILDKCAEVRNQIEDNLGGDSMSGIDVAVSPEFFSKLVDHAKVTDTYKYHQEASTRLGTDQRKGFTFGGITFWEYRANVEGAAGRLIAAQIVADVVERHRADCAMHHEKFGSVPVDFETGKHAKISMEIIALRIKAERASYGLDDATATEAIEIVRSYGGKA